ncbi:P1 family peptidase [Candidatus Bipolaricaulota bacterium]|nr:P1 family peptidase [Candidatus Bipolaricaulota bacterium]
MRKHLRDLAAPPGILSPGPCNTITDVPGVCVGHVTVIRDDDIRTGATAILPHAGNLYHERVPVGIAVANGFGKLMGSTQITELGELETPIVLTNTLAVPRAADAILDWTYSQSGSQQIRSINPVVGETNDGKLNAIEKRILTSEQIVEAMTSASDRPPAEGNVGAGTGTVAFGWKGGIGTSSRLLPSSLGGYSVGVLVQSNFGGVLQILGVPIGQLLEKHYLHELIDDISADGSIMIVIATDAPLSDRNLTRLARRAFAGLARTGSSFVNGSGDYAIAFSTAEAVRRTAKQDNGAVKMLELANGSVSPLFQAAIEATEEAILNSLFMAETMTGRDDTTIEALPLDRVLPILRDRRVIEKIEE